MLNSYDVAIVAGKQGVNINQRAEVEARLEFIARSLADDGVINLWVMGNDVRKPYLGIHKDLDAFAGRNKVRVVKQAGAFSDIATLLGVLTHQCDEVWCLPGPGQTYSGCPVLPARMYALAQQQGVEHWRKVKTIPWWHPLPEAGWKAKKEKTR